MIDKDLKEIIDVVANTATTAIKQLEDGYQFTDLFAFVPVLSAMPEAIKDANNALNYLKDMTEEKEEEIYQAVIEKLGDIPEKTKYLIRRIIRLLGEAYMTTHTFMTYHVSDK